MKKCNAFFLILFLLWTFANCIYPPYEGKWKIPNPMFLDRPTTPQYATVPAGRLFVWNKNNHVDYAGNTHIIITKINVVTLVVEYIAGLSVIGILYVASCKRHGGI